MFPAFLSSLEEEIIACRLIKSGNVVDIWKLQLSSGSYCIKHYTDTYALQRQKAELSDLQLLSKVLPASIPSIYDDLADHCDAIVLCLAWIESAKTDNLSYKSSAELIAGLHQITVDFAGLDYVNYIGELNQFNDQNTHWPTFWVERRLLVQLNLAIENKLLQKEELRYLENYISKITSYLPELSSFSLLHGDLWNGNVLTDVNGKTFLIDPAVYYGDPWVDLAMTALFGGFGPEFYGEYFEMSNVDRKGKELIPHYQLYYLLVHLNMFGRSYYPDIAKIVRRYT